ncbi:MAG: hypothetical protein ACXVXN_10990 [Mycobacteriaceae bacterium]
MSTTFHTTTLGAGHAPPMRANPSQVPRPADTAAGTGVDTGEGTVLRFPTGEGTVLRFPTGDARPFGVTHVVGAPRHAWRPEARRCTAGPRVRHCDGLATPDHSRVLPGHPIIGEALHG